MIMHETWRPALMFVLTSILTLNYIILPVVNIITPIVPPTLPTELWTLLTVTSGGYIVGRSGEKIVTTWKEK